MENHAWFDWEYGSFGIRLFGWQLHLKAPWCFAYFSERNGITKFHGMLGWRLRFAKVREIGD